MSDVYQEEQKETILINGIRLPLMPTDISAFSDNAILSEVYIRAPGAFAFRSKHSSSVIHFTLNLPITSFFCSSVNISGRPTFFTKLFVG